MTLVEVGIDFAVVSVFYVLGTIVAGQLSDKYVSLIFGMPLSYIHRLMLLGIKNIHNNRTIH